MIHIVFNESEVDLMKQVIAQDETLAGEVMQIKDDFAVGPLNDIYTEEGIAARKQWWREVLAGGDYEGHHETPRARATRAGRAPRPRLRPVPPQAHAAVRGRDPARGRLGEGVAFRLRSGHELKRPGILPQMNTD